MDPKGIESDRLEYVPSLQPTVPSVDVTSDKCEHVPDVQAFGGGVGKHHEVVVRPLCGFDGHGVRPAFRPPVTPLGFHRLRIVGGGCWIRFRHRFCNLATLARPGSLPYFAPVPCRPEPRISGGGSYSSRFRSHYA
jgi:hypothetical protein